MRESERNHVYGDIEQETKSNVCLFSLFQRKEGIGKGRVYGSHTR
jgi:hypothetical protein